MVVWVAVMKALCVGTSILTYPEIRLVVMNFSQQCRGGFPGLYDARWEVEKCCLLISEENRSWREAYSRNAWLPVAAEPPEDRPEMKQLVWLNSGYSRIATIFPFCRLTPLWSQAVV